jgi:hypothetical protein
MLLTLVVAGVWANCAAAQERPEDLVKAAIAAAGGEEVLARYPAMRLIGTGTMSLGGNEASFTCEQAYQIPGRFRTVIRCEVNSRKWELLQVVNDGLAKQRINGRPSPLPEAARKELQLTALLNEVAQLTPLLYDKKFTLKLDRAPKTVDLTWLIVHVKGSPDIHIAFDRKTAHLVRVSYKENDPESAKDLESEMIFDAFKTSAGLTRPTHSVMNRDGKRVMELWISAFTPLEKIDPLAFTVHE